MSPTSWPDSSMLATCVPLAVSSISPDSMKPVDTSLTIDSGGVCVFRPEPLMRTLQRARSHDGGETS